MATFQIYDKEDSEPVVVKEGFNFMAFFSLGFIWVRAQARVHVRGRRRVRGRGRVRGRSPARRGGCPPRRAAADSAAAPRAAVPALGLGLGNRVRVRVRQ